MPFSSIVQKESTAIIADAQQDLLSKLMKTRFVTLACSPFVFCVCGMAQQGFPEARPKGEVIEFGTFESVGLQIDGLNEKTLDGKERNPVGARFTGQTNCIPARIGTQFGFRFKVTNLIGVEKLELDTICKHPPIKNSKGEIEHQYSLVTALPVSNGYVSEVTGYSLDRPDELVPGEWTFEHWYHGSKLVSQSFTVVAMDSPPSPSLTDGHTDKTADDLFQALLASWKAADEDGISTTAKQLILRREGSLPVLPKLIETLRQLPKSGPLRDADERFWASIPEILGSLGSAVATPMAELVGEGEAKLLAPEQPLLVGSEVVFSQHGISRFELIARAFENLSVEGIPAVPRLRDLLEHASAEIRAEASSCLAPMGPLAKEALPRLRELCADSDQRCRRASLRACAYIDTTADIVVPLMKSALRDPSKEVRAEALRLTPCFGEAAMPLKNDLFSALGNCDLDPSDLRSAKASIFASRLEDLEVGKIIQILSKLGPRSEDDCEKIANLLTARDRHPGAVVARALAGLLAEGGQPAWHAIERYYDSVKNADALTQLIAMRSVLDVKPTISRLLPEISNHLVLLYKETPYAKHPAEPGDIDYLWDEKYHPSREDKEIQQGLMALMSMQLREPSVIPAIYENKRTKEVAWYLLGNSRGSGLDSIAPWLSERLVDADGRERSYFIEAVGRAGKSALTCKECLLKIVSDFDFQRDAVGQTEIHDIVGTYAALASITGDYDYWINESEKEVLQPILSADERVKRSYLNSYFAVIGELGLPSATHLRRWLDSPNPLLVQQASSELEFLGMTYREWAPMVLPWLVSHYQREGKEPHVYFVEVAAMAGPSGSIAVPILTQCLETYRQRTPDEAERKKRAALGSSWSRYSYGGRENIGTVFHALEEIGPEVAKDAIPVLTRLYEEEPPIQQTYDVAFLGSIRPAILRTLRALKADLEPLARSWVPRLISSVKTTESCATEEFQELAEYGPLAGSALPVVFRHVLVKGYDKEARHALERISPDNPQGAAWLHVMRFECPE